MSRKKTKETVAPRLLTEEQAGQYLGMSPNYLQNMRMETPQRYTEETFSAAKARRYAPPPYRKIGKMVRYDIRQLDEWIDRQDTIGALPIEGDNV